MPPSRVARLRLRLGITVSGRASGRRDASLRMGSSRPGARVTRRSADVALNGAGDGNYQLTSPSAATTATINQRNVTASISASDKTYDGTRDATITGCTLEDAASNHGVVSGDTIGCDASNGKFATKDAGSLAATADVALNGGDNGNYQLTSSSASTPATIAQRNVTASISALDKTYEVPVMPRSQAAPSRRRAATMVWSHQMSLAVTLRMGSLRRRTRVASRCRRMSR